MLPKSKAQLLLVVFVSLVLMPVGLVWGSSNARPAPAIPAFGETEIVSVPNQVKQTVPETAQTVTSVSSLSDVFQDGGDRLTALQNNDGGWDWPLDDGNPNNASPLNTIGPIAKGLAQAYWMTGDANHMTALANAGVLLLTKTNNFSPSDGYLAAELDSVFGGTAYTDHVVANFYGPLASGTYDRNGAGTLYDTAGYVNLIRTARASQGIPNLAAWDIGMGLVGAASAGADTTAWVAGVKAEIDELDGSAYYDVIGLAGAVYGLALVDEDYDPVAGEHAAASNLDDLGAILVGYQIDGGGFTWNSGYLNPGEDNETIQETAYAVLALQQLACNVYGDEIQGAIDYMISVQLATGGWEDYAASGENNEVTGEALWGISKSTCEPATITLSSNSTGIAGSVDYADEDIVTYDMATGDWSLLFDGSDVGLKRTDLDAIHLMDDGSILMSFNTRFKVPGFGKVDDSDIVRFIPTSLGENTAGTWEWFFDGSDVGLKKGGEDVDAIGFTDDGRLVVSTNASFKVPKTGGGKMLGADDDLIVLNGTLGHATTGRWEMYFDGSDVGLTPEDIWGTWLDAATGDVYIALQNEFSTGSIISDALDVIVCRLGSLGDTTTCTFEMIFDGSAAGFGGDRIDGLFIEY